MEEFTAAVYLPGILRAQCAPAFAICDTPCAGNCLYCITGCHLVAPIIHFFALIILLIDAVLSVTM